MARRSQLLWSIQKVSPGSLPVYHQLITNQALISRNSGRLRCLGGFEAVNRSDCRIST